jgi:predicted Rossmann fold nucleotide-binding protein DprA/Smf involved in DNA uptake
MFRRELIRSSSFSLIVVYAAHESGAATVQDTADGAGRSFHAAGGQKVNAALTP